LLLILAVGTVGCKSAVGTTVTGGVLMGVGGITAASGAVGLATSDAAARELRVANPVNEAYLGAVVVGGALFFIGAILLGVAASQRKKARETEVKVDERTTARTHVPSNSQPRFRSRNDVQKEARGTLAARKLFRRIDDLIVSDVLRTFMALDAVDQSLFLAQWRKETTAASSQKGTDFYRALTDHDIEAPIPTRTATVPAARAPF
jgi:hypothetical protein